MLSSIKLKFATLFVTMFFCFFVLPQTTSIAKAEECEDNSPQGKPVLLSAVATRNSVTLTWSEAYDPITHYLLAYGTSPTEMQYGNQNIGSKGTTSYTVSQLAEGVKYYFKVRPVNGCRPGDFSNKLSAITGVTTQSGHTSTPKLSIYKSTLGASTSADPEATPKGAQPPEVKSENDQVCYGCINSVIIISESIALLLYFHIARKFNSTKYIFSLLIPVIAYLIFYKFGYGCNQKEFLCKYFLPLDIIVFVSTIVIYKNKSRLIKTFFESGESK